MMEITGSGKSSILVESPVLFSAGTVGMDGSPYRRLLALDKFGAMVTSPLTLAPRQPARGPRVVPMPSGFLLHTGLPNPGVQRAIRDYENKWRKSILPIIVHLVAETPESIEQAVRLIEQCPHIAGIELGLNDDITNRDLHDLLSAARSNTDLPLLIKLPLYSAQELSDAAQYAGAGALIVAAPPRGTVRDPQTGRLIGGRLYGPWLKAQVLRAVGRIVPEAEVPVIACGGIHNADDARDYIAAGAVAVQLDSIVWINPKMAEAIASNLGGTELTRTAGALLDEWEPGKAEPEPPSMPRHLPEQPSDEENTRDSGHDPLC